MISTRPRASLALLAAGLVMAACRGKDSTAPPETFTLRVSTPTLTVHCGGSATFSSIIERAGFSGVVTITSNGLPDGVTIDFASNQFSGATTSLTADLSVEEWVLEGSYSITITGSSTIGTESVTFTLVIEEAPDFALSVSPAAITIVRGATGNVSVLIAREGSFAGAVNLVVANPPQGITGTFAPQGATGNNSLLTLSVGMTAAIGTEELTIQGDALGMTARMTTLTLTVEENPEFNLAMNPAAITVARGGSGTSTLEITRSGGFSDPVYLSLASATGGITASFAPGVVSGATSTVTISADASVAPGTYSLTIAGEDDGWMYHTATLSVTVIEPPRITMGVNPNQLTVVRGLTGTATVLVGRAGGFTGPVTLSLLTPPAGITADFNPLAPTGGTSTMTLAVAAFVPAGQYSVWVNGSGQGVNDVAAELILTVELAPEISLDLNPAVLSTPQWQSGASAATITRINFAGDVTLTSAGAPNGMVVSFNAAVTAGTYSTINVEVGLLVPVGSYDITVYASGAGVATVSRTLQVSVSQAPGTVVEYQFCSPGDRPTFFAVQDGTGPWKVVPSTEIGGVARYRFPLTAGYGGGVFIVPRLLASASSRLTRLTGAAGSGTRPASRSAWADFADQGTLYRSRHVFGTTQDLINEGNDWCQETLLTGTFTGTVQGYGAGEAPFMAMGNEWTNAGGASAPAPYVLEEASLGIRDLFATRRIANGTVDRFVILRDINANQGGALPLIDFNAGNAVTALVGNVTVVNPLTDFLANTIEYTTANGNVGQVMAWTSWNKNTVRPYPIVPPAARRGGDVMGVEVRASIGLPDRDDDLRMAMVAVDPGADAVTVTLGPRSPAATVSAIPGAPYLRLRAQGNLLPDYPLLVNIEYQPAGAWMGDEGNEIGLAATRGYLAVVGSASAYDLTMPDLSGLAGFPASSVLPSGEVWITTNMWNVTGTSRLSPNQPFVPGMQVLEGRTYRFQVF